MSLKGDDWENIGHIDRTDREQKLKHQKPPGDEVSRNAEILARPKRVRGAGTRAAGLSSRPQHPFIRPAQWAVGDHQSRLTDSRDRERCRALPGPPVPGPPQQLPHPPPPSPTLCVHRGWLSVLGYRRYGIGSLGHHPLQRVTMPVHSVLPVLRSVHRMMGLQMI